MTRCNENGRCLDKYLLQDVGRLCTILLGTPITSPVVMIFSVLSTWYLIQGLRASWGGVAVSGAGLGLLPGPYLRLLPGRYLVPCIMPPHICLQGTY
jgi:hypothetical protein